MERKHIMFKPLIITLLLAGLTACSHTQPPSHTSTPATAQSSHVSVETGEKGIQQFSQSLIADGISTTDELALFFATTEHKGNIINIMNRPSTSRPWYEFRKGNASPAKIREGKMFYQKNRQVIEQVAKEYGVPAEIILAILGIETNYGKNMGSFRLADSLSTLAFHYPRRAEFFQKELRELLLLSKEEQQNPFSFMGSYAGAMGMPQFMPSSFRKWAVDYDGDGKRNIWGSVPDVVASIANYLKAHGWKTGGKVLSPVVLTINPQLQAIINEKTALKYTMGELRQMGVISLENIADEETVILFSLETTPNVHEYFVGFHNFYTIWQYNHSRMYVTAVHDIAQGIQQGL